MLPAMHHVVTAREASELKPSRVTRCQRSNVTVAQELVVVGVMCMGMESGMESYE